MSDPGEGSIKNLGIFSTLEAATEVRFFLLAASFTLLIDNTLILLKQPNLIELAKNKSALADSNLAMQVILIFIAFSFFASLILPIAVAIFDELYFHTIANFFYRFGSYLDNKMGIQKNYKVEYDHVFPGDLRAEAHMTKDKYYLDLYNDYEKRRNAERDSTRKFAMYALLCTIMLGTNYYLSSNGIESATTLVAHFLGSTDYIWITLVILLSMVGWRFHGRHESESIYCPLLYKKLKEKSDHNI